MQRTVSLNAGDAFDPPSRDPTDAYAHSPEIAAQAEEAAAHPPRFADIGGVMGLGMGFGLGLGMSI
jgi:hypothetical protein